MKYFWIIVILALVLSPLIGLKSTPRQKKLELARRMAGREGVNVRLARRVDARDDERDLDSVCYLLPWGGVPPQSLRTWVLTHNNSRGMESEWPNWRWFEGPAPARLNSVLAAIIPELPEGVTGIVVDKAGVALHWDERGDEAQVQGVIEALKALRQGVRDAAKTA